MNEVLPFIENEDVERDRNIAKYTEDNEEMEVKRYEEMFVERENVNKIENEDGESKDEEDNNEGQDDEENKSEEEDDEEEEEKVSEEGDDEEEDGSKKENKNEDEVIDDEDVDDDVVTSSLNVNLDRNPRKNNAISMTMVYGLLKYRIKYKGDDEELKNKDKKIDEIWINYSGMPIYFGMKEFDIETVFGDVATNLGTSSGGGDCDGGGVSNGDGVGHEHVDDVNEKLLENRFDHDDDHDSGSRGHWRAGTTKKDNIYKLVQTTKKSNFNRLITSRKALVFCSMHEFGSLDFKNMIDIKYIDEIPCLIRKRHLKFTNHYDLRDSIMDLNFYNNFSSRYNKLNEEARTLDGKKIEDLITEFVWNDDVFDYCTRKRTYPSAMD
ncbi:hypothetical protein FXO38_12639 [Capsicum annuum]|nr:hypothetical protein FXO38_12639 [Capsicum annuum]KAF3683950.1 hypothetical protein FXO37_01595 [Capsicum annuum]